MVFRSAGRSGGRPGMGRGGGRYVPRRKVCSFCVNRDRQIEYKNSAELSRFITDRGKIAPRRKTGTCARHQRALAMAIKRARYIALLPFTAEHILKAGNVASRKPIPVEAEPVAAKPVVSLTTGEETSSKVEVASKEEVTSSKTEVTSQEEAVATVKTEEQTTSSGTEEAAVAS